MFADAAARAQLVIEWLDTVTGFEVQDLSITEAVLRRWPNGGRLTSAFPQQIQPVPALPDASPALFESLIVACQ